MATSALLLSTLTLCSLCVGFSSNSYKAFRRMHGRAAIGEYDSVGYATRRDLFHQRKAEVLLHNAQNKSWKKAVNRYSDYTDAELQTMMGYKRVGARWSGVQSGGASSLLQENEEYEFDENEKLAAEVDYRQNLKKSAAWVRNQGACGSCWAVAAIGALEMHAEKHHPEGSVDKLSVQQLIDCVPNPRSCGGAGGCKGATGELAFEFGRNVGLSNDAAYQSSDGGCNTKASLNWKVSSFIRLPENKGSRLKHAIATKGPVVVSVDGGEWSGYSSGVFSGCDKDTVVNHAVLGVGYGKDPSSKMDYWTLRNSWGEDWGEHGYMRIQRHANDNDYCGIDNKPKDGVFCDDGSAPASVPVCGMCGVTSDSTYPSLHPLKSVSRHGNMRSQGVL